MASCTEGLPPIAGGDMAGIVVEPAIALLSFDVNWSSGLPAVYHSVCVSMQSVGMNVQ